MEVLRVKGTKPEMIAMGIIDLRKFAKSLSEAAAYSRTGIKYHRKAICLTNWLSKLLFSARNVQSMLKLGRAQGVAMAVALSRDFPITEYAL